MKSIPQKRTESGQALVLVVFGIISLIGIVALAVDGGNAYLDQRRAQSAADSAATASALARIRGQNFVEAAYNMAKSNGYNNDGTASTVTVYSPPISGEHSGDIEYIQVIISSQVDTFFGGIIGRDVITNTASAISRTQSPEVTELLKGYAVVSLAPTGNCTTKRAFLVQGEATLDITGGGIFVNSNDSKCAFVSFGNGSVRIRDDSPFTIVGGASIQKSQLITPYPPKTGAFAFPYPPPFFPPKVGCNKEAEIIVVDKDTGLFEDEPGSDSEDSEDKKDDKKDHSYGGDKDKEKDKRMTAGSWSGEFPPEGVTHLGSGTYCVDEFIVKEGKLIGDNVTILVENGEVDLKGTVEISAPSKGPNAGLLIYLPIENKSKVRFSGEISTKGTILAPGSPIVLKGNSSKYGFHSQIIGYTINADGQSNMLIFYEDEENYDGLTMPEIEFIQ